MCLFSILCLFKTHNFKNIENIYQYFFLIGMVWESTKIGESIVEHPFQVRKFNFDHNQHIRNKSDTNIFLEGSRQKTFCLQVASNVLTQHLDFLLF